MSHNIENELQRQLAGVDVTTRLTTESLPMWPPRVPLTPEREAEIRAHPTDTYLGLDGVGGGENAYRITATLLYAIDDLRAQLVALTALAGTCQGFVCNFCQTEKCPLSVPANCKCSLCGRSKADHLALTDALHRLRTGETTEPVSATCETCQFAGGHNQMFRNCLLAQIPGYQALVPLTLNNQPFSCAGHQRKTETT